jgi:hypothetical protein
MSKIIASNEQPTCQNCTYSSDGLMCSYKKDGPIQKKEGEFCAEGRWMVRQRPHVYKKGKLVPRFRPKLYCMSLTGILADRLRYKMLTQGLKND